MSIINIFKKNKESILKPMDKNIYRFKLYRISKNINIDPNLSKEENILNAESAYIDTILGQILIRRYSGYDRIEYFKELATEKLIPVFYVEESWWKSEGPRNYLQEASPVYVKYINKIYTFGEHDPALSNTKEEVLSERLKEIDESNSTYRNQHIVSLEESKKYLRLRNPNGDSSAFLTALNEYFEQAEEYYRLAESKAKEEGVKQIVKSINNK